MFHQGVETVFFTVSPDNDPREQREVGCQTFLQSVSLSHNASFCCWRDGEEHRLYRNRTTSFIFQRSGLLSFSILPSGL